MVYGVLYKLVLPVNIWKAVAVINSLISGRLHCVFFFKYNKTKCLAKSENNPPITNFMKINGLFNYSFLIKGFITAL